MRLYDGVIILMAPIIVVSVILFLFFSIEFDLLLIRLCFVMLLISLVLSFWMYDTWKEENVKEEVEGVLDLLDDSE